MLCKIFFPTMTLKPNKDCDEYHCRKNQKKFMEEEAERLKNQPEVAETEVAIDEVLHEENEWGISLVDDDDTPDQASNQVDTNLTEGLSLAYERRVTMEADLKKFRKILKVNKVLKTS